MTKNRRVAATALATVGLVAAGTTVAVAEITTPNPQTLKAVGPVSPEHGFPVWYEDSNGLRLEQCLDTTDQYCDPAFLMGEMPNGLEPISFPENWPMESFYHQVGTVVDVASGGLGYVAALEATFANEAVQDGDQVVFGRVRFDLDLPGGGTYRVTHPYGVDTFEVSAAEADGFRYVEDLTPAPGNFALALKSRVNPFLVREGGMITAPNGNKYVGDPGEATRVTGSLIETADGPANYFRVEQLNADGTTTVIGETDLFNIMGKVSTNSGVNAGKAVLNETAAGTFLDVFASSDAGDVITVEGAGFEKTTLQGEAGRYSARIPVTDAPSSVKITNASDVPAASKTITVTDDVVISSAVYDTTSDTLTVSAKSTDQVEPPTLTLDGLTAADGSAVTVGADGTAQVTLQAAPSSVKVTSASGGADTAPVVMSGGADAAPAPTTAVAVATPSTAQFGAQVTLDGSSSQNAAGYQWTQTGGETVALSGGDTATATFTAPSTAGQLTFTLTVTGTDGSTSTSAPLTVTVVDPNAPVEEPPAESTAPVAEANTSLESAMVGESVTISATDSPNNASVLWEEPTGTVTIADPTAKSFTFKMPKTEEPLTFNLTVTGTDTTTATDSVTVSQIPDVLTATAQYRADKREWRINGTASVTTVNQVSVYIQKADGSKGALLGTSPVSAPVAPATVGDWGVRVRGGTAAEAGDTLWIESSRGGELKGVTFTRR